MLYIDFEANSEKEAIQTGLEQLGLNHGDVQIEVLQKPKKSLFGIGITKEKAKVRIFYKEKNEITELLEIFKTLLCFIDKNVYIHIISNKDDYYHINVATDMPGHLIGKNGKVIESLQNIINALLHQQNLKYQILVDVAKYNQTRVNKIVRNALNMAQDVVKTKEEKKNRPLQLL